MDCAERLYSRRQLGRRQYVPSKSSEPAKAAELLQANSRPDPLQPAAWLWFMGHAYYLFKSYDDAVRSLRECVVRTTASLELRL
jgi:cytochrome c-type biogenesis protein CcmH/NrfG